MAGKTEMNSSPPSGVLAKVWQQLVRPGLLGLRTVVAHAATLSRRGHAVMSGGIANVNIRSASIRA